MRPQGSSVDWTPTKKIQQLLPTTGQLQVQPDRFPTKEGRSPSRTGHGGDARNPLLWIQRMADGDLTWVMDALQRVSRVWMGWWKVIEKRFRTYNIQS